MEASKISEGKSLLARLPGIDQALDASYLESVAEILRLIGDSSGCPVAVITPLAAEWKASESCFRMGASEAEYDFALCAQTLLPPEDVMVVHDVRSDARFGHPLPTKVASGVRFYAGLILRDPKGAQLGALCIMDRAPREFSDQVMDVLKALGRSLATMMSLRQAVIQAGQLSMTDAVTGLPNRRAFLDVLSQTLARHERDRNPFSVLYFDLDGLKGINEALGWAAGNALLCDVSAVLHAGLRAEDTAARFGDDEFAAILVGGDGSEAALAGERIRALVKARSDEMGKPITVSVGAVSFLTRPCDEADALDIVSFLMLCAKQAGQDRVVCRNYNAARLPFDS